MAFRPIALRSKRLSSSTRLPWIWVNPRSRNWRANSQKRSMTNQGSPLPRRIRSPCSVSFRKAPSISTSVCQRCWVPSRLSAAAVVTSFMTDAGLRGVWLWWVICDPWEPTRLMTTLIESSGIPLACINWATGSGRVAPAPCDARAVASSTLTRISDCIFISEILNFCHKY